MQEDRRKTGKQARGKQGEEGTGVGVGWEGRDGGGGERGGGGGGGAGGGGGGGETYPRTLELLNQFSILLLKLIVQILNGFLFRLQLLLQLLHTHTHTDRWLGTTDRDIHCEQLNSEFCTSV